MAQIEKNMVGAPELTTTAAIGPAKLPQEFTEEQVRANAQLSEKERLEAAEKLLGTPFTTIQKEAITEMHQVGLDRPESGVYNYTRREIAEKIKKGKEAFSKEQWKALMRSGLAGRLSPAEFASFDPNTFAGDPKLERIAGKIKATGDAGDVDEEFLYKTAGLISRLDDEAEVDGVRAQDMLSQVKGWQVMADDPLLPYAESVKIEQQASREGASGFNIAKLTYNYYMEYPTPSDPVLQQELQNRRDAARAEIQNLVDQADQAEVLVDVRTRALDFYKQLKTAKRHDKWGRDKQQIIDYARRGYDETFWDDSPTLRQFEGRFRGVAKYVWDGIVSEAYKEMNGEQAPSLNVVAVEEFQKMQEQRRIQRLSEKKYETNFYSGRRYYELTAENAGELPSAILDWVRDQIAEIPDTDMQTVDGKLKEIRAEAEQLLGTRRVHLETEERQDVPETHPDFLMAKAAVEAVTDSVGYEKIISWGEKIAYEGGGEVAASYAERFASNYLGHHDAIYLMRRVARILLKLRTHKKGTYWTGHPFSEEKVDLGYMEEYRQQLQEEIIEDAATHDIYISDEDFYKRSHLDPQVNPEGRDLRYSFDDNIEKLLLDPGDAQRQKIIASGDVDALRRHDIRIKVFRDIKERLDAKEGWTGYTAEQRKNAIRARIFAKMDEKTTNSHLAEVTQDAKDAMFAAIKLGDTTGYDKAMWQWVEAYNNHRIKEGLHIGGDAFWYPSGWDIVRMKIDRPEKVLDRNLTDEQIDAMYEEVRFAAGVDLTDYRVVSALDEARFGFQVGRGYSMLEMEDAMYGGIRTRIRDPETGEPVDPDNKVRRVFDIVQERLERAIAEEEAELNQLKSTKQAEIDQARSQGDYKRAKALQIELDLKILDAQFLATHALKAAGFVDGKLPVWDGQLKDDSTINFFGNVLAAYGVNVAFGEAISHNSKDWLYEIIERGRRAWQSEWNIAAREYMVGTYPVVIRNSRGDLVFQLTPDGKAVLDRDGEPIPGVRTGDKPVLTEAYRKNVYGEPVGISERDRIVNTGAPREHRGITDTRFSESTSGGLAVPELIDELGDIHFAYPMAKLGVRSIAGLHGYIKRRDEVEASEQKLFTSMDPVYSAKERVAAYNARRAFVGGKYAEDKSGPGFGNEPFHGAFKGADWLIEQHQLAQNYGMEATDKYLTLMQLYRYKGDPYSQFLDTWSGELTTFDPEGVERKTKVTGNDLERARQLSYLDFDILDKKSADVFYTTLYGVYDYFQDFLKAKKGCIQSRGGRALRSWEEENHKDLYNFIKEMREAVQGRRNANGSWASKPENGFIMRLGYSPEIASEIAMRMLKTVLQDADYLILRPYEVTQRVKAGEHILKSSLTDQEMQQGFEVEIRDSMGNVINTRRTFVIPDEQEWGNIVSARVKKALENIRRRGLLEFMTNEGYELGDKKILGLEMPPYVQDKKVGEDRTGRLVASSKI